jgi:hypothetical protein
MKGRSLKLTTQPQYVCAVLENGWTSEFTCFIRLHALMLSSRIFRDALVVCMFFKYILRDSSVGIATGYEMDDQGEREFESR